MRLTRKLKFTPNEGRIDARSVGGNSDLNFLDNRILIKCFFLCDLPGEFAFGQSDHRYLRKNGP